MNKLNGKILRIQQMDALEIASSYVTSLVIAWYTYHLSSYINSLVKNQKTDWERRSSVLLHTGSWGINKEVYACSQFPSETRLAEKSVDVGGDFLGFVRKWLPRIWLEFTICVYLEPPKKNVYGHLSVILQSWGI